MNRLVVTFAATTLTAGVVAAHLWQQLRAERDQNGRLRGELAALRAAPELPRSPGAAAAAATLPPQVAQGGEAAATPAPAGGQAANAAASTARASPFSPIENILNDPEYRDVIRAQMLTTLPQAYPDLATELDLNEAEVARLFDLIAKHRTASINTIGGSSADPQDRQRAMQERQLAEQAELAQMLGSKYPQWQQYEESLASRQQVARLRSMLQISGQPLADTQAKPLIAALAAEQKRIAQDLQASRAAGAAPRDQVQAREENLRRTTENNRRLRQAAAGHLTPEQFEAYDRMLTQEERLQGALLSGMQTGEGGVSAPIVIAAP